MYCEDPDSFGITIIFHKTFLFQFEVQQTCVAPYLSEVYQVRRNDGRINIDLPVPLLIVGDIKIEFQQKLKLDILNLSQRYKYVPNPFSTVKLVVLPVFLVQPASKVALRY